MNSAHGLLGAPAPDFSDPLGLLAACHQRMLGHCELLDRLLDWARRHGVDDEIRRSVDQVTRYFALAAPHHHQDEEQDLFPLLRRQAALRACIDSLGKDHRELEIGWQDLAPMLDALREGEIDPRLGGAIERFTTHYRRHIAIENTEILPRAAALLSPEQCDELGRAMARRRNVKVSVGVR